MTDHNCPECGDPLIPTTDEAIGSCINCQWSGDLDDAIPDTTSPLSVALFTLNKGCVGFIRHTVWSLVDDPPNTRNERWHYRALGCWVSFRTRGVRSPWHS